PREIACGRLALLVLRGVLAAAILFSAVRLSGRIVARQTRGDDAAWLVHVGVDWAGHAVLGLRIVAGGVARARLSLCRQPGPSAQSQASAMRSRLRKTIPGAEMSSGRA